MNVTDVRRYLRRSLVLFALCDYDSSCLFFFFQAEDGIRDLTVTGVQTCALPISVLEIFYYRFSPLGYHLIFIHSENEEIRSEERRVGKECRSRWSPYH